MKRFLVAASFAVLTMSAFALPTIDAVQAEIAKGNTAQAEEMMREVVAAKPASARARYVYAEVLAHNKRFALAAEEAAQARKLDPSLSFTQADKFNAFTQLLAREQAAGSPAAPSSPLVQAQTPRVAEPPPAPTSGGVPGWAWGLGAAALALLAWWAYSGRQQAATPSPWPAAAPGAGLQQPAATGLAGSSPGFGVGGAQPGAVPGAVPGAAAPGPSARSGLLGTGLAVAGGMAAGALAERLFEGRRDTGLGAGLSNGIRGTEPFLPDDRSASDAAARELEQRPIDVGNGDGWGGGSDSDVDAGTGSDPDGW
jgi:hypothetical protein